jgi:glycosyltransferase involved in cell wall biosynthesis
VTALRVLQVDAGREWRGGQNQVRLLCRALHRTSDVQVRLLTRGAGDLARRAGADGVHVRGAPWTAGLDPRALLSLWAEWRAFAPHIVHAHDSHALRLALWARLLGARSACVVATRRVDFPVRRGGIWSRADRVIAISHAVRAVLAAGGLAPADVPVVPSGIDPDEVRRAAATPFGARRRLGLPEASPLVVNVAALVDHKDHGTLIRAAAAARLRRPDLPGVVAGTGARAGALAREIARHGVGDRVHLLGYVAEADALIREASVFVLSSREEGLGSVLLNALALDRPVVATAAGGIVEIVPPDGLVPVGNAAALADAVVRALAQPRPVPLPPRFTAAAMAQGVLDVYRSLL